MKREALQDDLEFALLLVGVLVFPLVELEAAFHQERAALLQVLGDDLGLPAEGIHINKGDLFFGLAGLAFPVRLIARPNLGDGRAFGRVAQFGVAGQVAREDDFVEVSHRCSFMQLWLLVGFGAGALVNRTRKTSSFIAKRCFNWSSSGGLAFEDDVDVEAGAVLLVGDAAEVLLVHLLHGFHLAAQRR